MKKPALEQRASRAPVDPELLKEVRRIQIRSDRLVTDVVSGGYSSVFRGSGIEFDEVREWTEGDDFRSVDWNVTARMGRPYIKKYVEERELTLLFVLDRSRSMGFGTERIDGVPKSLRRLAVEFIACLGLSANRNNDKVGFVGFGEGPELFVPPKKGRPHLLRRHRLIGAPPADRPAESAHTGATSTHQCGRCVSAHPPARHGPAPGVTRRLQVSRGVSPRWAPEYRVAS